MTTLYRAVAADGTLLYVGCTDSPSTGCATTRGRPTGSPPWTAGLSRSTRHAGLPSTPRPRRSAPRAHTATSSTPTTRTTALPVPSVRDPTGEARRSASRRRPRRADIEQQRRGRALDDPVKLAQAAAIVRRALARAQEAQDS